MKMPSLRTRYVLLATLVILLALGAFLVGRHRPAPPPAAPPGQEAPRPMRTVILYFASEDGRYLVAEEREIEDCPVEEDCLRETVQALLHGSAGELTPVLPRQAVVRGVAVEAGTAVVDFSADLVAAHPGGSMSELFSVYALANTLAVNFPHIRQVRILVEGEETESLKGHVDLSSPIQADFTFAKAPEGRLEVPIESLSLPTENTQ